jgi:single-stranded-DNA-specific exonuclease
MIDSEVGLAELTLARVEELAQLEPVGQGNPGVRLAINGLSHQQTPQRMGKENQHVKLRVTEGKQMLEAVWWNVGRSPLPEGRFDLAVTAAINEYKGRRSVQLKVLDWRPCE